MQELVNLLFPRRFLSLEWMKLLLVLNDRSVEVHADAILKTRKAIGDRPHEWKFVTSHHFLGWAYSVLLPASSCAIDRKICTWCWMALISFSTSLYLPWLMFNLQCIYDEVISKSQRPHFISKFTIIINSTLAAQHKPFPETVFQPFEISKTGGFC